MSTVPATLRVLTLPAVAMALGLVVVIAISGTLLGAAGSDLELLALFLVVSGVASQVIAVGAIKLAPALGLPSLRARMVLAHLVVLLVALLNIAVTAGLMFISGHDLGLLGILLFFSAIVAMAVATAVSSQIRGSVRELVAAAREVSHGSLGARVRIQGEDELAELGRAFNVMAAELEKADEMRRELEEARRHLVAAISHDLRTPIGSIGAMVEAINDRVVTDVETVDRYLRAMQGEVARLGKLIDDLFELSQLEAGALTLRIEPGSLRDLLSDTLESLQPQALAKGVRLSGHVDSDLPPVTMDTARIQRVLDNLVQNAIRHTPRDGIIVLEAQEEAEAVRVDVIDSGQGVSPGDLSHIFERFYRGEKSRTRNHGGAGLGLAIAKGLVEAHGGRIWVQNVPRSGARFSFLLPKAAQAVG